MIEILLCKKLKKLIKVKKETKCILEYYENKYNNKVLTAVYSNTDNYIHSEDNLLKDIKTNRYNINTDNYIHSEDNLLKDIKTNRYNINTDKEIALYINKVPCYSCLNKLEKEFNKLKIMVCTDDEKEINRVKEYNNSILSKKVYLKDENKSKVIKIANQEELERQIRKYKNIKE